MPTFTHGAEARTYADLGLVEPGATVEADENPDPRFFTEAKPKKSAKSDTSEES